MARIERLSSRIIKASIGEINTTAKLGKNTKN